MAVGENDEGVTAIVGVILMVVITIVLAVFVVEFAFQLNHTMPEQHNVATNVKRVSTQVISVQTISGETNILKSGGTSHNVQADATYTCTVNDIQVFPVTRSGVAIPDGTGNFDASAVGAMMYFPVNMGDRIQVIAHFTDDTSSIIYSGQMP